MRLRRVGFEVSASAVLLFSLAVVPGLSSAQQAPETAKKAEPRKASKVWTNDDFPSSQTPQPRPGKGDNSPKANSKPGADESKAAPAQPPDARTQMYEKMTPQQRQDFLDQDEIDLPRLEKEIRKLNLDRLEATDEAQSQRVAARIADDQRTLDVIKDEMRILRTMPLPEKKKKDSDKNPSGSPPQS